MIRQLQRGLLVLWLLSHMCHDAAGRSMVPFDSLQSRHIDKTRAEALPFKSIEVHKINSMLLSISNIGQFGIGFAYSVLDPETGLAAPSCEFPAGSNSTYLFIGAIWAGAVVGRDTLVTVGFDGNYEVNEFWPQPGADGAIIRRSNMKTSRDYSPLAVSEQDFICTYTDTFTNSTVTGLDPFDNRPHVPLGLKVTQRTYAWSYDYASDFVMFDFTIQNINRFRIKQLYLGVYVDPDIYHASTARGWIDDINGFLNAVPSTDAPGFMDTVRIAWAADNDGDPTTGGIFDYTSVPNVVGSEILRTPSRDLHYSYNWWIANQDAALDFGPRKAGTPEHPFRDMGGGLGSPDGDRNKYYIMSNNEIDYSQLESAISHTGEGWLPPPKQAEDFADGYDARYLLSFGPFNLDPGDTLPITMAYVAGEKFHQNGNDFRNYWDPTNPQFYESKLSYANLGYNAKWAKWIFDNPGVDTDHNGDSGKVHCYYDDQTRDTVCRYYEGDGVPDFLGASPPPAPNLTVRTDYGKLFVRWNGEITENSIDPFSQLKDFEGYRIYIGKDNRITDYVLLTGYDRDDFNVYTWVPLQQRWGLTDTPLLRDSLKKLYGNEFDPEKYSSPDRAFLSKGEYFYFVAQGWNISDLSNPHGIHRLYPDANLNDPWDTTAEGHHRYYEYEYEIDNLEPSIPYHISVTAFDFGSRKISLSSLESSPNTNAVEAYPLPASDQVEKSGMHVQVYPNPYRVDGGYAAAGYENRDRSKSAERSRSVHFINLPNVCTIRIYTPTGDLVAQLDHNFPGGGPLAQEERWNLISRNTQAIVTGIYLYSVTSTMGDQLGKLVIIK